jgi:anti-anti-sigma factor
MTMELGPKIEVSHEGAVTVVELLDEEILEEGTINTVADSLFAVVADNPGIKLLLSFERVRHLSSSALGTLIRLNKRVEKSNGILKICHLRKSLLEIFKITKLNRLFDIYEDKAVALSSFTD